MCHAFVFDTPSPLIRGCPKRAGLMSSMARPYLAKVPGVGGQEIVARLFLPHEGLHELTGTRALSEWTLPQETLVHPTCLARLVTQWTVHQDVTSHPDPANVIAIGMHADGVQYTSTMRAGGAKSIIVMSWNAISARAVGDRAQRRLLTVIAKSQLCDCGCGGFDTLQGVWVVVAWSFQHLMLGTSPSRRHDGSPFSQDEARHRIPAGIRLPHAALLQLRGDWEWFYQCFRFRTPSQERFCFLCDATRTGPLCGFNFSARAPHRATLISHETYLLRCAAEAAQPCGLFSVPGVRLDHVCIDSMHSADLGAFADALESLFDFEITWRRFYPNRATGLRQLNKDLAHFYRSHPGLSSAFPLHMSQIRSTKPGGYPFLKCKAAQTRHLAEFGLTLALLHRHGGGERQAFAFSARSHMVPRTDAHLNLLVELFRGMTAYCRSLATDRFDPENCRAGMLLFLESLGALNALWRDDVNPDRASAFPFHVRPKSHMLLHLALDQLQVHGSPAATWCYSDESFVGSIKRVANLSKHPNTLEQRVGEKAMLRAGRGQTDQAN